MYIPSSFWIAAGFGLLATASVEAEPVPDSWIEVCNGKNHNNECGKVDMSEKYLGKCKTIPNGVFYNKVMSVKFEGLPAGSCCELFDGIDCFGNRTKLYEPVTDLAGVCGFGGDGGTTGKTKSFACHGADGCAKLDYPKNSGCKDVPLVETFL